MKTLTHGPGLGDCIYACAVIKYLKETTQETYRYGLKCPQHYRPVFDPTLHFFRMQPYIAAVDYVGRNEPNSIDLDTFRRMQGFGKENIITTHFKCQGIEPPKLTPWLTAEKNEQFPIIVHRSPRYHGRNTDYTFLKDFPAIVVGYFEEARPFRRKLRHVKTPDFAALAAMINGCKVFIGNQSSPLAVAVGLGKKRLYERYAEMDDCRYPEIPTERHLTNDPVENKRLLEELLAN